MGLTEHNAVSIAELVVYVPALVIAILLCIRHGFGRSAGWFFLIIFTLARILGPCLQLATIGSPTNIGLYVGAAILQNTGFSALLLASLGLLGRALTSINKSRQTLLKPRMLKLITLLIVVGLILGIVGGSQAGNDFSKDGVFRPVSLNKIGTILFVISFVLVIFVTIFLSFHITAAEDGEKRLLYAVAASLPLLAVRLVYSCLSTFSHDQHFNLVSGSITILLVMCLIEEFVVVVMYEAVGLTLKQIPKPRRADRVVEDEELGNLRGSTAASKPY